MGECECESRARDRHPRELFRYVPEFHCVALEELASRGGVKEEVAHREARAHRGCDAGTAQIAAAAYFHLGCGVVLGAPGLERDFRHRRDAGQRFPSEAVGEYVAQIRLFGDFGGGVALEAEHRIGRTHAASVVNHLDKGASRVLYDYLDFAGTCVHGIFHKLLHDGGRSLDHFPRRYHICQLGRQYFQFPHLSTAGNRILR